jgi:hypothetical protein
MQEGVRGFNNEVQHLGKRRTDEGLLNAKVKMQSANFKVVTDG